MIMAVASGTSTPTSMTVVPTSTFTSPARNRSITASRSRACIWPWTTPIRASTVIPTSIPLPGRAAASPPPAPPRPRRPPRKEKRNPPRPPPPAPDELVRAPDAGLDRQPPGRRRAQVGDVEVGVQDPTQRLGDGRGGHEQDVGRGALRPEGLALGDPEAVLLVHDGQPEVGEGGGLLHEGVRADRDQALAAPVGAVAQRRPQAREGRLPHCCPGRARA